MKIYVLTFHGSVNYGAVLQAYALAKTLSNFGYDCEVIDYNRIKHHKNYLKVEFRTLKSFVFQMIQFPDRYILHKKFNKFTKEYIPITKKVFNGFNVLQEEFLDKDDIYIVGSDQVWNSELTENNLHYFLDFTNSKRKYSYAASFGVSDISCWNMKDEIIELLKKFRRISVREESGKEILKKEANLDAEVVCDPTFLLNREEWNNVAVKHKKHNFEKFILIFMLTYDHILVDSAWEIAKNTKLPIINIAYTVKKVPGIKSLNNIAPEEWLGLLQNAEYVFTNSFHGFALALNFQRQVWVTLTNGGRNSRILDLASRYCISNHIIREGGCDFNDIDYTHVNKKIDKDRKNSRKFLEELLNGETNRK